MRLDRFLSEMNLGTRSQVKGYLRQGLVTVNGVPERSADRRIAETRDLVSFQGRLLRYRQYVYYMLNKPAGVVSATRDSQAKTVVELLGVDYRGDLFPVGRLDKDTEGLLLLTNDGDLAHRLLSPSRHVDKVYQVKVAHSLSREDVACLEQGVDIGEEKDTLPAVVEVQEADQILLTIQEGKFHQVKRMLQAVDNQVLALKRIGFGGLRLDGELEPGAYRELREEEVTALQEAGKKRPDKRSL